MNTAKTWQIVSSSSGDTFAIGEQLGRACKGGEVFVLTSDLGGGKTTFVKGLAKGLGSLDIATSPTFTINRTYACRDNLVLEHFDFYRLNDPGIVAHELSEVIDQKDTIIAIEWGDIVGDVLPTQRIEIAINRRKDDENKRELIATYPAEYGYVFEESK